MPDNPYYAGSGGGSWNYTDPHNDLTHQWMMEANAFNAEQAQITRDWQEKMSNTAYQRAMADMTKAGLNPILAGNLGGASTPGGATATANFTGAGATSSGGSSYWSRSIADSMWNMGMDALNSAGQEALGQDLAGIIRQAGSYIGKLMNQFTDNATMMFQNDSRKGMPQSVGQQAMNGFSWALDKGLLGIPGYLGKKGYDLFFTDKGHQQLSDLWNSYNDWANESFFGRKKNKSRSRR